ncbi:class I SAM-dependent methyltransferase [Paenibacillus radicis (ex Xue et al. 2023)]|uniref:Class I SAM-dependent methyltransferase n=1 Tax=Paenibacillus radicis (ex Xue et al. 2023) TaxID=2972489 RepID=A0ABT1YFS3_9BACL|nr:class I SAM-dependent methyltransferase [Paenibacillus radicis (ex Xue et al. 2023)]MCR8632058.1 class I SAM-dependent methyltransferase [Paenibacillus radicis (ex Xue et al. 2023)]
MRERKDVCMNSKEREGASYERVTDQQLQDQLNYYRERAPEYDDWWYRRGTFNHGDEANRIWFDEVSMVKESFKAEHFEGDFLELAAGTGTWSCLFLKEARTLTVVDGSVEMLSHNPVVAEPNVRTIIADLFSWSPDQLYDSVAFTFWISHLPRERLVGFFTMVSRCLKTGGKMFFVDDREVAGTRESHVVGASGQTMIRKLNNGDHAIIVKNFFGDKDIQQIASKVGIELHVHCTPTYFQYGVGSKTV